MCQIAINGYHLFIEIKTSIPTTESIQKYFNIKFSLSFQIAVTGLINT